MSTFSKIPDVDREILFKLPNREILELCKTNLYFFNRVCNDNFFYRLLLDRYPDFIQYKQDNWSWKRLFLTIIFNEGLIEASKNYKNLFIEAIMKGQSFLVKLLLADKRVNPADDNNYAIRLASRDGHTEVVKLLLADPRVDPADYNNEAIRWASTYDHVEIIKLLLADRRVDPTAENNMVIRSASAYGHTEVIKVLLADKRVNPAVNDNEAIKLASANGHVEVVNLLKQDPRVQALL